MEEDLSPHVHRDNLTRLLNQGRRKRARVNRSYSFFVRSLRLLLPIIALGLVAVVMIWPDMEKTVTPVKREEIIPETTGRNELINPRFESKDKDMHSYIITATRAVQSLENQDIVMLEKPAATIALDDLTNIDAKAERGTYQQETQSLALDGRVVVSHSHGYTLKSESLNMSMKERRAWTDMPVRIDGPSGNIEAQSMKTDDTTGVLTFNGPAKMTLKESIRGL